MRGQKFGFWHPQDKGSSEEGYITKSPRGRVCGWSYGDFMVGDLARRLHIILRLAAQQMTAVWLVPERCLGLGDRHVWAVWEAVEGKIMAFKDQRGHEQGSVQLLWIVKGSFRQWGQVTQALDVSPGCFLTVMSLLHEESRKMFSYLLFSLVRHLQKAMQGRAWLWLTVWGDTVTLAGEAWRTQGVVGLVGLAAACSHLLSGTGSRECTIHCTTTTWTTVLCL